VGCELIPCPGRPVWTSIRLTLRDEVGTMSIALPGEPEELEALLQGYPPAAWPLLTARLGMEALKREPPGPMAP
jgi:hypothetical protein